MDKVVRIEGVAAPLLIDNIDTDALAPTSMLTSTEVDFGRALLGNWRYKDKSGTEERGDFILNRAPFRQARILVAGANFGCGSSREHAVWALMGFGIRSVIAAGFSDIFYENALKNGLLPIILPRAVIDGIGRELEAGQHRMVVDLDQCHIVTPAGASVPFQIDPSRRLALLEGLDEIGLTLKATQSIADFQARDRVQRPWIYAAHFQASEA